MFHKTLAQGFFIFSILAGVLAAYGWGLRSDIWLASTQWMQIAIYLLLLAVYIRISEADDIEELKTRIRKKMVVQRKPRPKTKKKSSKK
ncbi:MAG TPA: hypothetical protein GX706_01390 [Candidatus Moranbacteria bacterium]|nr:hypothetical protein [Candidatus Moranbacteria bacterium]